MPRLLGMVECSGPAGSHYWMYDHVSNKKVCAHCRKVTAAPKRKAMYDMTKRSKYGKPPRNAFHTMLRSAGRSKPKAKPRKRK